MQGLCTEDITLLILACAEHLRGTDSHGDLQDETYCLAFSMGLNTTYRDNHVWIALGGVFAIW